MYDLALVVVRVLYIFVCFCWAHDFINRNWLDLLFETVFLAFLLRELVRMESFRSLTVRVI